MDAESPDSDSKDAIVRRACDQCRQRKIRCDKRSPCSNCRTSKIACCSTGAGQKPREPRKRVLISNEYEKKIDNIDERLGGIEQALLDLKATLASNKGAGTQVFANATPVSRQRSPFAQEYRSNPQDAMDQQESKSGFEGNSLMATESAYASDFLQTAVSRSSLQMSASNIDSALSTLKQLVNMQDNQVSTAREFPRKKRSGLSDFDLKELIMPPMHVVIPLLRNAKDSYGTALQTYCPFLPFERLAEKCREVYFNTEDYSDATFIVANGGLYQLFVAVSFMTPDRALQEEYQSYVDICRHNLDTTLANLHLLMPATTDSVEALTMAAAHAIEISKPSFALTLTSTASRLCQAMEFHQMSSLENLSKDERERRLTLFWSIYSMDRALSLRLGRAATIPDYDIDVPDSMETYSIGEPWKSAGTLWIELARVQGLVYERLYSAAALRQSEATRAAEARNLAAQMQERVMKPFERVHAKVDQMTDIESLYLRCDEVCRLSVLCLIYRAIPTSPGTQGTFVKECIETARAALLTHESCMALLKDATTSLKLSYLHWTIMYSPFVPFIVLFCHVIEVSSWEDLNRLDEFVVSLKPNCTLSTAIAKLHRLCQALSNVARLYIEAKEQAQTQENQALASVNHEFDTYLSALGFAPPTGEGDVRWTATPGVAPMPGDMNYAGTAAQNIGGQPIPQGHMTQLGNWFSGNQYMLGLLEEDVSMFDRSRV
ncbi:putative C6 transcription factor [Aspergillus stella-maris]|uniref:putative C6 transcription factor n=1 Tax=Aspergillus stella-maris TaxID=1810926 RepID=UPI003CCDB00B